MQANKHPGAQERAQEEHHHDEEAFSDVRVGVSKYGRWWYKVKMRMNSPGLEGAEEVYSCIRSERAY